MIDNILYKLCSDPVKFLLVQIQKNIDGQNEAGFFANVLNLYSSACGKMAFSWIEKYLIRKHLVVLAKRQIAKGIYAKTINSEDYNP